MNKAVVFIVVAVMLSRASQPSRTFVSGGGNDDNPGTLAAPCRSFQAAHNKTAPGGEVVVLDTAGYGPVKITKPISILNEGAGTASITVAPGEIGLLVQVGPAEAVVLRGLMLEGNGSGGAGIFVTSAASVTILNCSVRGLRDEGIGVYPNTSLHVVIAQCVVSDIASQHSAALQLRLSGSVAATATIAKTIVSNNGAGIGLDAGNSGTAAIVVSDCIVSNNRRSGTQVAGAGGSALISNSVVSGNGIGLIPQTGATLRVTRSQIIGNGIGIDAGGRIADPKTISYGDNVIDDNQTDIAGTLTSAVTR